MNMFSLRAWLNKPIIDEIHKTRTRTMSALSDLQTAVAALQSSLVHELEAIATALANAGADPVAVEAAVASINAVVAQLDAETATLLGTPSP